MSVDSVAATKAPDEAKPGVLGCDTWHKGIVRNDKRPGDTQDQDWWMAEVIHCGGAARDPSIHNLFQVADVDSGVIRWINADLVTHILADR